MALQMNVSGIRRNLKNIAHNYTDAQVKVREATSNDPWGPSSTLMSEVADLTYNVVAFTEIMQMIWKRLNDHGRNWRHVYKALVLLEYLIKTGSEKVADQCKENIFAIETLKDFQYIEENKDQGMNVREKAKALVTLLKDEERLRNERVRALKAKERFAQSVSGIGSDSDISSPTSPTYPDTYVTSTNRPSERNAYGVKEGPSGLEPQLEAARPQTVGEEELQLQLALAMSKEEAEQEEQKKRSDDVRLQMAITQSEEDFKECRKEQTEDESAMNDLLDINFNPHSGINGGGARPASTPPTSTTTTTTTALDPWGMPTTTPPAAAAASVSPQHTTQVKSLPGVDFSPPPPPVPPLPSPISSFPTSFSSDTKIANRHSNPPLLESSPLLFTTHRHNHSSTPSPNPFHSSPSIPRPTSLLVTSPPTSSSMAPSRHSLFPPSSSSYVSMLESPLSTHVSSTSTGTLPGKSSSHHTSAPTNSPWVPVQTDPWGMALPNGGSETPNQPDPWGSPVSGPPSRMTSPPTADPWAPARSPEPPMGGICGNDPWAVLGSVPPARDPWEPVESKPAPTRDPFSPLTPTDNRDLDEFSALSSREKPTNNGSLDAFNLGGLSASLTDNSTSKPPPQKSKSPASFLGENSNLVNLDNLVSAKQAPSGLGTTSSPLTSSNSSFINNLNNNNNNNNNNNLNTTNPFATGGLLPSSFAGVNPFSSPSPPNPFQAQQAPKPSMNQLRTTGIGGLGLSGVPPPTGQAPGPWGPTPAQPSEENPFLL